MATRIDPFNHTFIFPNGVNNFCEFSLSNVIRGITYGDKIIGYDSFNFQVRKPRG